MTSESKPLDRILLIDIDGTLAELAGKRSPFETEKCETDDLNPQVAETVKLYYTAGFGIVFCSGREERFREATERFIEKHLPRMDYKLLLRKTGDMRKDTIIKEELYKQHIEGKLDVFFVLEDRSRVVDHWRSLGLVCWQVKAGDY